jgi:hypothetical protein
MQALYKTFHKVQSFVLKSKSTFPAIFLRAKPIPEVCMILADGAESTPTRHLSPKTDYREILRKAGD